MTTIAEQLPQRDIAILQRFIDGQDPAQISDAMNLGVLEVGAVINSVKRSKTRAREVLDQQSPLTAPILHKPKVVLDEVKVTIEKVEEPAWSPPVVDLSGYDDPKMLLAAAEDLDDERVHTALPVVRLALAELRQMVEQSVRRQAVMDERAELLARMAAQDEWIATGRAS